MTTMFATRAGRRRGIALGVLLAVTLVMMMFSANPSVLLVQRGIGYAFKPFQAAVDGAARGVSSVVSAIAEIDRLRVENGALRSENARLQNQAGTTDELRREVQELTALLQLRNGFDYHTVGATVIAREPSEFRRLVTIDKGTDDGIVVGDVVVVGGGALAGRITEVGGNYARLLLLTDTTSTVIGQFANTASTGEVAGGLDGPLVMSKIDAAAKFGPGAEVVTAGIELAGGIRSPYPKGLVIGQVVDVRQDPNSVVKTAYLQPAANLDNLEYVLVITDYRGGLQPSDQQPLCSPTTNGTLPDSEQPCATRAPTPAPTKKP
jgi:rod shape-determining protein MreC